LNQDVIFLHTCGCAVPWIWESINGTVVHNFMVSSTVQVPLQSVVSWGNLVGGSERNPSQTER
jgi:hypothetical protein